MLIALLLVACGDDEARPGTDASVERLDMAGDDAATPDGFVVADGGGAADARPPDAAAPTAEDCSTDEDEDGDGQAGCQDPDCLDEARCVDADLEERGFGDWSLCQSLSFDAADTRARCEEGLPAWVESSRDLRCELVPTEVQVDVYCPPEGGDEASVQMRWRVAMDTTAADRMLGPNTHERTHFMPELTFSNTVTEHGAGGSAGDALYPTAEDWAGYRAVGWRSLPRGARFVAFTTVSVEVSTFTIHDGGVDVSSSGPDFVHNAAFEVAGAGL